MVKLVIDALSPGNDSPGGGTTETETPPHLDLHGGKSLHPEGKMKVKVT